MQPKLRWILTPGRMIVLYVSAALFGGNVILLVQALETGGLAIVGPALGAVAMTLLSIFVLYNARQAVDAGGGPRDGEDGGGTREAGDGDGPGRERSRTGRSEETSQG